MQERADFIIAIQRFRSRIEASSYSDQRRYHKMYQLFTLLITHLTDDTKVQFTSLFARLSYLINTYNIPYKESYILHILRKTGAIYQDKTDVLKISHIAANILMNYCLKEEADINGVTALYKSLSNHADRGKIKYKPIIKVFLKTIDLTLKRIEAQLLDEPFDTIIIAYDRPDRNEDYTDLIDGLDEHNLLPLTVNLIDIEIDDQQIYYPASIVFEPDFMYDVTAISECFGPFANHQAGYLLRKFLKKPVSKPILVGNISNFFLDQLVYYPNANFEDFLSKIFTLDPLGIALLSDQEVREMIVILENHFNNIKDVVINKLPQINVRSENCQVEPSFYSAKYGIQGRLDLFSIDDQGAAIVELKSGSTFRPNSYGLSNNHYHQTLLYDMLIESVFGKKVKRNNFILYSKASNNHLRYAPALKVEQREAIKERNQLYIHDRVLLANEDFISYYQDYIKAHDRHIKGFQRKDFSTFLKSFNNLDTIERIYCNLLLTFTLREFFINKLGNEGSDRSRGLSTLWTQDIESKKEQFNILNNLKIINNGAKNDNPVIILQTTEHTAELSNFRVGDLGIFYPSQDTNDAILREQVFKVTILGIDHESIIIRLRSRQENIQIFSNYKYWHIEHDSLENGYYEMSRSIYEYAQASQSYRDLIMCRRRPDTYATEQVACSHHLTEEQGQIFSEIIKSKEYYLLWGPPGTGKTSVMLREMAHHYISHEQDRVIFLAYTNRAVDEICEALYSLDPRPSFIRIGSRYSTGEKFQKHLLQNQIVDIKDRKSLREKLSNEQVYVGTVASVVGKVALFQLIKFDLAVIDEASQILETSLIGLLSRVGKFVLIGDHLQLPAVVQQDKSFGKIENKELNDLGHTQLSSSLFERMYLTAVKNNWEHAIGQLTHQGRMHIDIMSFINNRFYNNELKIINSISRLTQSSYYKSEDQKMNRILFYPSKVDMESDSIKINDHEAKMVVGICAKLINKCLQNNIIFTSSTIGIITPYRAQIAAIRKQLQIINLPQIKDITIDTVERYQGGARDIIVMSCCMNYSFQLGALVSLSEEGVDRKLNVAITRAREQFILVGNQAILEQSNGYARLIEIADLDNG